MGELYGIGLIQYLQNWAVGFTDWNMLLDSSGGPSHDRRNGCNAPLQANSAAPDGVAIQAPYYFLYHFAKFLVPNSTIVGAMVFNSSSAPTSYGHFYYANGAEGIDGNLAALAAQMPNGTTVTVVLNTGDSPVQYRLRDRRVQLGAAAIIIPAHSIQTIRWNV
eukprot:SAG31_NODE_1815_length_7210_cov_7.167628_6_plen_163_part_00